MAFQDDFAASLSRSGVTLSAAAAPSRETLELGLEKLKGFISSLDIDTAAALEEVTTNFPVKALLADPAVDIAPELSSILTAFDHSNVHFSVSDLARLCQQSLVVPPVPPVPPPPKVPTIDTIQPKQFTLHSNSSSIFVGWSVRDICDKYHFMWTDRSPTPQFAASWNEFELDAPGSRGFAFRIPNTSVGKTYTFKVQGCRAILIGPDSCSEFTADTAIKMPGNTHSLRQFLLLSRVPLDAGVRSLGPAVFGAGIRKMLRI